MPRKKGPAKKKSKINDDDGDDSDFVFESEDEYNTDDDSDFDTDDDDDDDNDDDDDDDDEKDIIGGVKAARRVIIAIGGYKIIVPCEHSSRKKTDLNIQNLQGLMHQLILKNL